MTAGEVADYLRGYAAASAAPVVENAEVLSVVARGDGYAVDTTAGSLDRRRRRRRDRLVRRAARAGIAAALDPRDRAADTRPTTATRRPAGRRRAGRRRLGHRRPARRRAGRAPAARWCSRWGSHSRLPRRYRGLDIMWWLDAMGVFDRRLDEHPTGRGAREPSLQLVGQRRPAGTWTCAPCRTAASRLAGRLTGVDGRRVALRRRPRRAPPARPTPACARCCDRIDAYVRPAAPRSEPRAGAARACRRRRVPPRPAPRCVDRSVVWATGYRRAYPWLHVPVLDRAGEIGHVDGATPAPGPVRARACGGSRGAARRSSTASGTTRPRWPAGCTTGCASGGAGARARGRPRHERRVGRRRGRRARRRRLDGAAAGAGRVAGAVPGPRPLRQRHPVDARADAGGHPPVAAVGPARRHRRGRHPARTAHGLPLRRRRRTGGDPSLRRGRRALRAAPDIDRRGARRRRRRRRRGACASAPR